VFQVWNLAEPNATIIAACIPVLRVLFRSVQDSKSAYTSPASGGYIKSNNHSRFHPGAGTGSGTGTDNHATNIDGGSDRSILGSNAKDDTDIYGITRTREVTVNYDVSEEAYEMKQQQQQRLPGGAKAGYNHGGVI
jgi:hypothetical protein